MTVMTMTAWDFLWRLRVVKEIPHNWVVVWRGEFAAHIVRYFLKEKIPHNTAARLAVPFPPVWRKRRRRIV